MPNSTPPFDAGTPADAKDVDTHALTSEPMTNETRPLRTFDDSSEANAWERDDRPLRQALNAYVDCVVLRVSGDARYDATAHAELSQALDTQIDALFEERRQISINLGCPSRETGLVEGAAIASYELEADLRLRSAVQRYLASVDRASDAAKRTGAPCHDAQLEDDLESLRLAVAETDDQSFAKWLATQTFRVGPRRFEGATCHACGEAATFMLARPYDLSPAGEVAQPACAEHAVGLPEWTPGGTAAALRKKWESVRPTSETPAPEPVAWRFRFEGPDPVPGDPSRTDRDWHIILDPLPLTSYADSGWRVEPLFARSSSPSEEPPRFNFSPTIIAKLREACDRVPDMDHLGERITEAREALAAVGAPHSPETTNPLYYPLVFLVETAAPVLRWLEDEDEPASPLSSHSSGDDAGTPEAGSSNERTLRRLLWDAHPCQGKYGDDGELQCASCRIDFKRDSVAELERHLFERGLRMLAEASVPSDRGNEHAGSEDTPQQMYEQLLAKKLEWFEESAKFHVERNGDVDVATLTDALREAHHFTPAALHWALDVAAARIATGSEDAARLDWWFERGLRDSVCDGSVDLWWADEQDGDAVERVTHGTSVRDALDKAMQGIYESEDASRTPSTPAAQPETNDAPSSQPTPETT